MLGISFIEIYVTLLYQCIMVSPPLSITVDLRTFLLFQYTLKRISLFSKKENISDDSNSNFTCLQNMRYGKTRRTSCEICKHLVQQKVQKVVHNSHHVFLINIFGWKKILNFLHQNVASVFHVYITFSSLFYKMLGTLVTSCETMVTIIFCCVIFFIF